MAQQQINLATEGWDSAFNDNVDELNQQLASVLNGSGLPIAAHTDVTLAASDSNADLKTTLDALVASHNSLLAKLRNAGAIAT